MVIWIDSGSKDVWHADRKHLLFTEQLIKQTENCCGIIQITSMETRHKFG